MSGLTLSISHSGLPALIAAADDRARIRFLEFFAVTIRNPHTRCAYIRATGEFLGWCAGRGVASLAAVQPLHVAGYFEELGRVRSVPTVKLRLAAVRNLFDWLVVGQVVPFNLAASVRGPSTMSGAVRHRCWPRPKRASCSTQSTCRRREAYVTGR